MNKIIQIALVIVLLTPATSLAMGHKKVKVHIVDYSPQLMKETLLEVKEAMRMYPEMELPVLVILETQLQLDARSAFFGLKRKGIKAFYMYNLNSIYTTEENFTMRVLHHELCHAVLSHDLKKPITPTVAEPLCQDITYKLRKRR